MWRQRTGNMPSDTDTRGQYHRPLDLTKHSGACSGSSRNANMRDSKKYGGEREGNCRAKNYYCRETNKITMVCGWFIRNKQCHHCWESYLHGQDSKLPSSNHLPYTLTTHHHIHSSSWATLHPPHFVSPQIWSDLANTHKADITRSLSLSFWT